MGSGRGLKALFIVIGVLDFATAIFFFMMVLNHTSDSSFSFYYYGLFVLIGIGVVNGVLSMLIPAIRGTSKAVPGLVFSIIGSVISIFSITFSKPNMDKYKENEEQEKKEESEREWLTIADIVDDPLSESGMEDLKLIYAEKEASYEGRYTYYSPVSSDTFSYESSLFKDGQKYSSYKMMCETRITNNTKKYQYTNLPIKLEHEYLGTTESGTSVETNSYYMYGRFGYLHFQEIVDTKSKITMVSQVFEYVNDDGFLDKIGFVEFARVNDVVNEYYGTQYVIDVTYGS